MQLKRSFLSLAALVVFATGIAQADELNAKMLAPDSYTEAVDLYVDASDALECGYEGTP